MIFLRFIQFQTRAKLREIPPNKVRFLFLIIIICHYNVVSWYISIWCVSGLGNSPLCRFHLEYTIVFILLSLFPYSAILGEHFVDCHQEALIARVHHTDEILDKLLHKERIPKDACDDLRNRATQEQMKNILRLMKAAGREAQDALVDILRSIKCLRPLMAELDGSQWKSWLLRSLVRPELIFWNRGQC